MTGRAAVGRPLAVITGGAGGIGLACAREFGLGHDLILADIASDRLTQSVARLEEEGYSVAGAISGDLADTTVVADLAGAIKCNGKLAVLVHAAGISATNGDWQDVLRANLVATARLMEGIEPLVGAGCVAVLIASMAGHLAPADGELDAILDAPLKADFAERVAAALERLGRNFAQGNLSGVAYAASKRAIIRMCALKAPSWGARRARIVSISPGVIWTPMARANAEASAAAALRTTPIGRWGTAMEIAQAASFLASDKAGFITGTDLRIDGGSVAARAGAIFGQ